MSLPWLNKVILSYPILSYPILTPLESEYNCYLSSVICTLLILVQSNIACSLLVVWSCTLNRMKMGVKTCALPVQLKPFSITFLIRKIRNIQILLINKFCQVGAVAESCGP